MEFLLMDEVARCGLRESLGFPSIGTCMAVVLQTQQELIGWHSWNFADAFDQLLVMAEKFRAYANSMRGGGGNVHLYVAGKKKERRYYWQQELQTIAKGLKYSGPATSVQIEDKDEDGTYFEFTYCNAKLMTIRYKVGSKVTYTQSKKKVSDLTKKAIYKSKMATTQQAGPLSSIHDEQGYAYVYTRAVLSDLRLDDVNKEHMTSIQV
jgi:hypothetical protein